MRASAPGGDGSSQAFVEALDRAGAIEQDRMRQALVMERGISVREGDAVLAAHPGVPGTLTLSYHLDYGQGSPIASQSFCVGLSPESFRDELAASRTFVLESEADALRAARHRHPCDRRRPLDLWSGRGHRQCLALP